MLVVLIIVFALIVFFLIYYFSNKQVIIRTLSKLPNKPSGGFKTNYFTKVSGKALHVKEPLIAPFSKRKCIFYKILIEQKKSSGKSSHWRTIVDEQKIQALYPLKKPCYSFFYKEIT